MAVNVLYRASTSVPISAPGAYVTIDLTNTVIGINVQPNQGDPIPIDTVTQRYRRVPAFFDRFLFKEGNKVYVATSLAGTFEIQITDGL